MSTNADLRVLTLLAALVATIAFSGCGTRNAGLPAETPPIVRPPPVVLSHEHPRIDSISPTSAEPGSANLQLVVAGSDFDHDGVNEAIVIWSAGGHDTVLTTTNSGSASLLTATIPAALLADQGVANITVENHATIAGDAWATSRPVVFTVSAKLVSHFALTAKMREARSYHEATLLSDGKVLITGGWRASAELFDPSDESFVPTGNMTTARSGSTDVLLKDGKVLIAGGFDHELSLTKRAELYDPSLGTFSATGNMIEARAYHTATLLADGRVLIAGGTGDGGGGGAAIASAEVFDPISARFSSVGDMISPRAEHSAASLAEGLVLISGGWAGHRADSIDEPPWDPYFSELFNPASGKFSKAAKMSTPRFSPVAIALSSGDVLILGGIWDYQNVLEQPGYLAYAEVYEDEAGTFRPLLTPRLMRQNFTATLASNGKVLLIGGTNASGVVNTVEFLDPATGGVVDGGELVVARVGHTATRLNDGRILVVGGADDNGNELATAELCSP